MAGRKALYFWDVEAPRGERWRSVEGFDDGYEVSNHGRVRHLATLRGRPPRLLRPYARRSGLMVTLHRDGTKHQVGVHRLVAAAFLGPLPPDRPFVRHLDGDATNNRAPNLAYMSTAERSARIMPRLPRGAAHHSAKLAPDTVREIRAARAAGATAAAIARAYGVDASTTRRVLSRRTWAHVTD